MTPTLTRILSDGEELRARARDAYARLFDARE